MKSITIPSTVTFVGRDSFRNCISLEDDVFCQCESLTKITLPESLTTIGNNSFRDYSSLEDIVLPSNLEIINSRAFEGCYSLKDIVFSKNMFIIKADDLKNCGDIKLTISTNTYIHPIEEENFDLNIIFLIQRRNYVMINAHSLKQVEKWSFKIFTHVEHAI